MFPASSPEGLQAGGEAMTMNTSCLNENLSQHIDPRLVVANSLVGAGFRAGLKPAPTLAKRITHPVSKCKLGVFVQSLFSSAVGGTNYSSVLAL